MTTKYVLTIYTDEETNEYTFESDIPRHELETYLSKVFTKVGWKEIVIGTRRISRFCGSSYALETLEEWFQFNLMNEDTD